MELNNKEELIKLIMKSLKKINNIDFLRKIYTVTKTLEKLQD